MKKLKRIISAVSAVIIAATAIPAAALASGVQSGSKDYIIFEATTDLFLRNSDSTVNAELSEALQGKLYNTHKAYDDNGSFYSALLDGSLSGGLAAVKGAYNSQSSKFGWLSSKAVLNALSPYLYIGFDYRVSSESTLPEDTRLTVSAAQSGNTAVAKLAEVKPENTNKWCEYPLTKISATAFSEAWSTGYISFGLNSATGLEGGQTVDLKNIIIILKEADKTAINTALRAVSGIDSIQNFTKGIYLGTAKKKDYFRYCFSNFDQTSARSGRSYSDAFKISVKQSNNCDLAVSRTLAKGSDGNTADSITVSVKPDTNYNIKSVTAVTADGTTVNAVASVKNSKYTFNMPPQAVTVTAEVVYEEVRDLAFLWKCHPGTMNTNPWYKGASTWNCAWSKVDGGNQTAYRLEVTENQGSVLIYGTQNTNVTASRYYDNAYFYTSLRLDTESENRTVKLGISDGKYCEVQIPEAGEYTLVKIPLKDIASSADFGTFQVYLDNRTAGDVIYIGESFVFNRELGCTVKEAWDKILDISDYEKQETNTLLGVIGDTEGLVDPWCENRSTEGNVVNWDIAWYYSFQNVAPYILIPAEDLMGKEYFTTFYGDTVNATDYADTGYMEFFIKCDTDGIEVPFSIEATGHANRTFAEVKVKYEKAKAREDGYMCVRVPFSYLSDAGLNIDKICRVTIKGRQTSLYCDFFLISSFRFYSNYADVPEPEPIVEPEPEPERDMPVELDTKIINAKLDKENKTLYVPGNTQIWELLSALTFDTDETNVDFYDGKFVDDESTVITENMKFAIYRRGYILDQYKVKLLTEEVTTTQTVTEDEYYNGDLNGDYGYSSEDELEATDGDMPKTGDSSHPTAALITVLASFTAAVLLILNRKRLSH